MFSTGGGSTFGSTTPFGGNNANASFGGFTSAGFGAAQTPAANTGGGMFGQTATSQASGGMFGTSAAFGQQQQQQQNKPAGFSFGGTNNATQPAANVFGTNTSQQGSSLFSTPNSTSAFGAKTPAAGGFGATTQSSSLFGATNTTSLFGQSATAAPSTNLFGTTAAFGATGAATSGTIVKFNPPAGTDSMVKNGVSTNISTRHQCITAMPSYEAKSLEELRMEDYAANRKGPQPNAPAAGGMFGTVTQQSTQQQQQPNTGFSFGTAPPSQANKPYAGFGTTTTTQSSTGGLFGNTQTNTGGLFGAQKPGGLFGTATTSTATTTPFGGFGGTQQNAGSTSLFGGTQQAKPGGLFGTTTTQAGGLFGTQAQPAAGGSSLFGGTGSTGFGTSGGFGTAQPSAGGLFGAAKPTGFGQPTSSSGLTFGGQSQAPGGLFGSKPGGTTGFNFGQTSTAGFGAANQTGGGLFGTKPPGFGGGTGGLANPAGGFGTGFGTALGTGSTLFAGNQAKPGFGTGTGLGTGLGTGFSGLGSTAGTGLSTLGGMNNQLASASNNAVVAAQQVQIQQQVLALTHSPYGDSPLFRNLKQDDAKREEVLKPTNPAAQKAALNASSPYKVSPRPVAKVKPKLHSLANGKSQLFDGLEDEDSSFGGNETFVPRKSVKKLVIKSNHHNSPNTSMLSRGTSQLEDLVASTPVLPTTHTKHVKSPPPDLAQHRKLSEGVENDVIVGSKGITNNMLQSPMPNALDDTIAVLNARNRSRDDSPQLDDLHSQDTNSERSETPVPHPAGIVLRRSDYFTMPTLEELAEMVDEDGNCIVDNFVVGREGYGNIFFAGETNLAGMNLDEIVHFRRKEVTVYPDDDRKPPVGEGLNKRAQVTLDCVWPNDKSAHTPIKSPERLRAMSYQEKIEQATAKIGAKFVDYRPDTGSWVFEVKHFSKYGLLDESDDENDNEQDPKKLKILKQQQEQQLAVQKNKIQEQELEKLKLLKQQGGEVPLAVEEVMRGVKEGAPAMDEDDSIMEEIGPDRFLEFEPEDKDVSDDDYIPSSHKLATSLGVQAQNVQMMKASFFGDEEDEDMDAETAPVPPKAPPSYRGLGGSILGSAQVEQERSSPVPGTESLITEISDRSLLNRSLLSTSHRPQPDRITPQHILSPSTAPIAANKYIPPPSTYFTPRAKSIAAKTAPHPSPEHRLLPSGMTDEVPRRKITGAQTQRGLLAFTDSVMYAKQNLMMDSGMFHGRQFRVGWSNKWTLCHCGKPTKQDSDSGQENVKFSILPSLIYRTPSRRLDKSPFQVSVEEVHMTSYADSNDDALLKSVTMSALEIQLRHSVNRSSGGCPLFVSKPGVDALHEYTRQIECDLQNLRTHPDIPTIEHMSDVWNLAVALWGHLPGFSEDTELERSGYDYQMSRREALSQWLSSTANAKIHKETEDVKYKGKSHLYSILSHLTGRHIVEACQVAQESGDHRLAMLLAQASGSEITRKMLLKQLSIWEEQKADQFLEPCRLRLYVLLAGEMVWNASGDNLVNVCERLDWKRCLAAHLWYHCNQNSSIKDAVNKYDAAFNGEANKGKYAVSPRPPYVEKLSDLTDLQDDHTEIQPWDTCYHMLKLYCDRSHRLEKLLAPATSTPNQLDFRLSWHLLQVLEALEYSHVTEFHYASLCCSFASQLEAMGLWHWAAFVLLHIKEKASREHAVKQLLCQHLTLREDEAYLDREAFLRDQLHIPTEWIHHAKALKAKEEKLPEEEAWHLLKAQCWNESHIILIENLAADGIIQEEYDYLKQLLVELAPAERSSLIIDWAIGGKVFLDYITMVQTLDRIKQEEVSAYELERLQPEVASICERVGNLTCRNARDRLCQCEMAKRTANVMKTLLMLQHQATQSSTGVPIRLVAPHVTKLPMPEDYTLQELRDLTRGYLLEMTS